IPACEVGVMLGRSNGPARVLRPRLADDLRRYAEHERPRRRRKALRQDGPGPDDRLLADDVPADQDRRLANKDVAGDDARVHQRVVSDGDVRADERGLALVGVDRRVVLHVRTRADDDRLVAIFGPCSIHDPVAALDYARRLRAIGDELRADLVVVMRAYFMKPRTSVGWKGLVSDPHRDGSFRINDGLRMTRRLLL